MEHDMFLIFFLIRKRQDTWKIGFKLKDHT